MPDVPIAALREAIRNLHGCDSTFVESVPVRDTLNGRVVWEGAVCVFDLIDHPKAKRAYAWSWALDNTGKRRFVVVLHDGPATSPLKAVQAAIVAEHRGTWWDL